MSPAKPLSADLRPRLLYARLLFLRGQRDERDSSFAFEGMVVLSLQDSVELVLRVAAEHLDADVAPRDSFENLIQKIDAKARSLDLPAVPNKLALQQLNNARVSFKHYGILPPRKEIGKWTRDAENALAALSRELLGIEFESVSLVSLIHNQAAANFLAGAEGALRVGRLLQAVEFAKKGFNLQLHETPFFPAHSARAARKPASSGEPLARNLALRMEAVESKLDMLAHGISLPDYRRFAALTPSANLTEGGTWFMHWKNPELSPEEAAFCVEFAVDSVMRLEENKIGRRSGSGRIETTSVRKVLRSSPLLDRPAGTALAGKTLEAGDFVEILEELGDGESNGFASVVDGERVSFVDVSVLVAP